jgi:hypothetical protein
MAKNNEIEIDFGDYEHETNDVAKEQENSWQRVKKRRKGTQNEEPNTPTIAPTKVQNLFNLLKTVAESNTTESDGMNNPPRRPKAPPIFIYGVKHFKKIIKSLSDVLGQEAYYTKTLPDETVKVSALTIDTYRKLIQLWSGLSWSCCGFVSLQFRIFCLLK